MREILFRAKRTDNGTWAYGFFAKFGNKSYILTGELVMQHHFDDYGAFCYKPEKFTVNPQTIGQYTGLTDKNGKKIFEGDVVRTKNYGKIIGHANVSDFDTFRVVYSPCAFRLERNNPDREFMLSVDCRNLEVIGNIHDSPELVNP